MNDLSLYSLGSFIGRVKHDGIGFILKSFCYSLFQRMIFFALLSLALWLLSLIDNRFESGYLICWYLYPFFSIIYWIDDINPKYIMLDERSFIYVNYMRGRKSWLLSDIQKVSISKLDEKYASFEFIIQDVKQVVINHVAIMDKDMIEELTIHLKSKGIEVSLAGHNN
ncbi:MAG: hypothetical protein COA78_01710 [Blastopirellula sp.]|nr:MAG: hypothetical protein COA78_01710 [Blastopirellula sp.]